MVISRSAAVAACTRPNLSDEQRRVVYKFLLIFSVNGKVRRGMKTDAKCQFNCSGRTISRIWRQGRHSVDQAIHIAAVVASCKADCIGRKRKEVDLQVAVKKIPLKKRETIRSLAHNLGTSKSLLHRHVKDGEVRVHSSAVKPFLTTENKLTRLVYFLAHLILGRVVIDDGRERKPVG
jgi:hypothetical protein